MGYVSKAKLIERAKALGLKVNDEWTKRHIEEAIAIAEEDAAAFQEEVAETLGVDDEGDSVEPEPTTALQPSPESDPGPAVEEPIPEPVVASPPPVKEPTTAPAPPPPTVSASPSLPVKRSGGAGRYCVLWTITYNGSAIHASNDEENPMVVDLDAAAAKSLLDQEAVVHEDDYESYLERKRAAEIARQPAVKPQERFPVGAGNYRTTCGVMKNGQEIPAGTVDYFTAEEVVGLTRPGMMALAFPDDDVD
jgi:hypothetical protein